MMYRVLRHHSTLPHAFRAALNSVPELGPTAQRVAKGLPLSKIVATIGPASENHPVIGDVARAGMQIMRINFSHATYEEADLRTRNLNSVPDCLQPNVKDALQAATNMRAIMLDTQGPEIRTGSFGNGIKEVEIAAGQKVTLSTDASVRTAQTQDKVWISYTQLQKTAGPGSVILLDDGAIGLRVTEHNGSDIVCVALNGGTLGNKKGVNMPKLCVELPAMSKKDEQDIRWGIENDIDIIAASFVRKPSDVEHIRSFCQQVINELASKGDKKARVIPKIISKIESTEGLENFDAILDTSDGIMVARGDLGVEIPMETLPACQKEIVRRCRLVGKPVIVATQMLESMQKNPRPTRAEALDVANAILDGADCVMLSGESAKGKYPVDSVATMNRIVQQTEISRALDSTAQGTLVHGVMHPQGSVSGEEAVAFAIAEATRASSTISAVVINAAFENAGQELTKDAQLPVLVAKYQPNVPIFLSVPTYKAGRLLQVYRGMKPVLSTQSPGGFVDQLKALGALAEKSSVIHAVFDEKTKSSTFRIVEV